MSLQRLRNLAGAAVRDFGWLPWAVLLTGAGLTWQFQAREAQAQYRQQQVQFTHQLDKICTELQAQFDLQQQVLTGVRSLFVLSPQLAHRDFAEYVSQLRLAQNFPGVVAVGYIAYVPAENLARHLAATRADGLRDYSVWPAGARAGYAPVAYLAPLTAVNRQALGFDILSESVRQRAMLRARDENQPTLTSPLHLVQISPSDSQAGMLLFLPVYRAGRPTRTVSERTAALQGWVDLAIQVKPIIQRLLESRQPEFGARFDLDIFAAAHAGSGKPIFDSNEGLDTRSARFVAHRQLDAFGQSWIVRLSSLPAFEQRADEGLARAATLARLAVSVLLALLVATLLRSRRHALHEAGSRGQALEQSEARHQKLQRARRLLSACNMAMMEAREEHELLNNICQLAVEKGGYLMSWVGWAEHDAARTVRPVAQSGFEAGYLDSIRVSWGEDPHGQGPTGEAIRSGQTQVNQRALTNPRFAPWRAAAVQRGFQSSIALPLAIDGKVLGCLTMYAHEPDAFDEEEVRLLEELASDLSFGMEMLRTRAAASEANERAMFLQQFDKLTGLPNRLLLRDRFEFVAGQQDSSGGPALLFLDLDGLQYVNESLGYHAGDALLCEIARRLQQGTPAGSTVSRHGADAFVVLLPRAGASDNVAGVAQALCELVQQPFDLDGNAICVTVSIGIATVPTDGSQFDAVYKAANTAMHSAKNAGGNTAHFYQPAMNDAALEQLRLAGHFKQALERNEFQLHYQPQIDLRSGMIIGAEALLRWQHPELGQVSPARFIPIAERSGHIVQLGQWVLRQAVQQASLWQQAYGRSLTMAVNVSALQFRQPDFAGTVHQALQDFGLPPALLELELTESILLQAGALEGVAQLRGCGVQLSVDDFGTGYSSLSYLRRLSADKLKIDKSFIDDVLQSPDGAAIVHAIIQMGQALRMTVIAEGVESLAQREFLQRAGCDEMQGYQFSRPLPAAGFERLLAESA